MLTWKIKLIAAAVVVAAAFFGGWQVNGWRLKSEEAKAMEWAQKSADAATVAAVTAIKGIEVKYVTIKQRAETVTREVPVYRDCLHTDDGLRVVNEALTGHVAPAGDSPRLPGPDGTQ